MNVSHFYHHCHHHHRRRRRRRRRYVCRQQPFRCSFLLLIFTDKRIRDNFKRVHVSGSISSNMIVSIRQSAQNHKSQISRNKSNTSNASDEKHVLLQALVVTEHFATNLRSHVTRHTSHVTRHTSHVTHHTSHVTRHTSQKNAKYLLDIPTHHPRLAE